MRCETDKNTKNKYDLTWMTSTFVPPSTLDPILVRVSTYTQAQIVDKFIFTFNPEMILDWDIPNKTLFAEIDAKFLDNYKMSHWF